MALLTVRVPGKIILSGEHAVVYGYPAIVMAVNRWITIQAKFVEDKIQPDFFGKLLVRFKKDSVFDIINSLNSPDSNIHLRIESTIPVGCGMGSSAALAAGIAAIVLQLAGRKANKERINELAYGLERQVHYNPSGVDNSIVVFGGCLRFQKISESEKTMDPFPVDAPMPELLVINTGKPQESTGEMVQLVRQKNQSGKLAETMASIGEVSQQVLAYLSGGSTVAFPSLLQRNEMLLERLGVVSASTQKLIRRIEAIGGAAKISGAGGTASASGIVIAYHEDMSGLKALLASMGAEYFPAELNHNGIEITYEN